MSFWNPADIRNQPTDLKRELMSEQVKWEINELNSPTALRRFGAPFKSDYGEVSPLDSELPILRYIFVHHVRDFPFLDKAKEKEFWQDKLQVVSYEMEYCCSSKYGSKTRKHGTDLLRSSWSRLLARTSPRPRIAWRRLRGESWRSRRKSLSSS
jgi:hypothetical protein